MDRDRTPHGRPIDRRTLLKGGLLATGALAGGGVALGDLLARQAPSPSARKPGGRDSRHAVASSADGGAGTAEAQPGAAGQPGAYSRRPNILVIMVDQLRTPCWFSATPAAQRLMPNLASLRSGAVAFDSHYTASNDCSPARATLLTGLYTHQTGCMITGGSTLSPGFPTWGTMLREQGYRTWWYGKWHLTHGDNHWSAVWDDAALEPYGFSGGTYPSPDGGPGQGWGMDPFIAAQFEEWISKEAPAHEPWCTTVSFVNPHDIAWWYRWSDRFPAEARASSIVDELPPNFETPAQMQLQQIPRLQFSHQETTGISFGRVPFTGPQVAEAWTPFFDLYLKLMNEVDHHIGTVLRALHSRPDLAANTVVVFTSDHGEYGGSHGMRGKGGAVYEEGVRVPLMVRDLRGGEKLTAAPRRRRTGLTSSVDVAPLLLGIATGSDAWRKDSHYSHIAHRHDLLAMLRKPQAPGRTHILHASDEIISEYAIKPYAADAPLHLTAIRTPKAKLALYSNWMPGTAQMTTRGQEAELYDYRSAGGRMEIESRVGQEDSLEADMRARLQRAAAEELHEGLPARLHAAQRRGFADYFDTASDAVIKATHRRRRLLEQEAQGHRLGGGLSQMLRRQHGRSNAHRHLMG
jgi:arylsulfatase A-like enzyme